MKSPFGPYGRQPVQRLAALVMVAVLATSCGGSDDAAVSSEPVATEAPAATTAPTAEADQPEAAPELTAEMRGVTAFDVGDAGHTEDPVTYEQSPPVGGDHNPGWQNCGFYEVELPNEQAVHSLEHGAVWITFLPDAPETDVELLRTRAGTETHLLVSPYPNQTSPFVLTAWARQMEVDTISDPNVEEFLDLYMVDGPTAPEPNVTCASAYGIPPLDVFTINQ